MLEDTPKWKKRTGLSSHVSVSQSARHEPFSGMVEESRSGLQDSSLGRLGHRMRRRFAPVRATRKRTPTAIKRTGLGSHPWSPRSARQIACARVFEESGTERQDSPWWSLGPFEAAAASHGRPNGEAKPNRNKADRFGFADTPAIGESERPQMARDGRYNSGREARVT